MKTVVLIPTLNEAENIVPLLHELDALSHGAPLEVLVVDDASSDGTAERVRAFAKDHPHVSLLAREAPHGRGHAGREGFMRALERGADVVLEMDGDGSHDPQYIPDLLGALEPGGAVFGSRGVPGGHDDERNPWRKTFTHLANFYARWTLGVALGDPNSGFRAYTREALEALHPETLTSAGCEIVQETTARLRAAGVPVREMAVTFRERRHGKTKKTFADVVTCFAAALRLRLGGGA